MVQVVVTLKEGLATRWKSTLNTYVEKIDIS